MIQLKILAFVLNRLVDQTVGRIDPKRNQFLLLYVLSFLTLKNDCSLGENWHFFQGVM